ncbi:MAG: hypothetical protein QXZ13_01275 [Candidatus Diapherotrites archaeon]
MKIKPTKESTRKTIVALEKAAKKSKNKLLRKVAEALNSASRKRVKVNIYKLSKIGKKSGDKTLVVPGKVLSAGEPIENMKIVCLACSEKAKRKIEEAKGKIFTFANFEKLNLKPNEMVIVK